MKRSGLCCKGINRVCVLEGLDKQREVPSNPLLNLILISVQSSSSSRAHSKGMMNLTMFM